MYFFTLVAAALACPAPGSDALVGRWESVETSRGGIGSVIEFRADGRYIEATAVLVEMRYDAAGGRLRLSDAPGAPPSEANATPYEIRGDKLILKNAEMTLEASRVGPAPSGDASIVGAWTYRHYTGAMSFDRYTDDGRYLLRLPMLTQSACYTADANGSVTVTSSEGTATRTFRRIEKDLELGAQAGTSRYRPSEFGGWYDIEKIDYQKPVSLD